VIDTHLSFDEDDVFYLAYTVKKGLAVFPSPTGMSLTKLSLDGNNLTSQSPRTVPEFSSNIGIFRRYRNFQAITGFLQNIEIAGPRIDPFIFGFTAGYSTTAPL